MPASLEASFGRDVQADKFRRKSTYTEPRSITLDSSKLKGVPAITIWTGYAVMVVSKSKVGHAARRVEIGPQSFLLDYDETLEVLQMSTGKPKNTDDLYDTVYLRVSNNQVSDLIYAETCDHVQVDIKVSIRVDFEGDDPTKWFQVENYVKYLTDHVRSVVKGQARKVTIEEFYQRSEDLIRDWVLGVKPEAILAEESPATEALLAAEAALKGATKTAAEAISRALQLDDAHVVAADTVKKAEAAEKTAADAVKKADKDGKAAAQEAFEAATEAANTARQLAVDAREAEGRADETVVESRHLETLAQTVVDTLEATQELQATSRPGMVFDANAMRVIEVEVLEVLIKDAAIQKLLNDAQHEVVAQNIDLAADHRNLRVAKEKEEILQSKLQSQEETAKIKAKLDTGEINRRLALTLERVAATVKEHVAQLEAQKAADGIEAAKTDAHLARQKKMSDQDIAAKNAEQKLRIEFLEQETAAVVKRFEAGSGGMTEALLALNNQDTLVKLAQASSIQTLLGGGDFIEVINRTLGEGSNLGKLLQAVITNAKLVPENGAPTSHTRA